jgi:hypothetical protein
MSELPCPDRAPLPQSMAEQINEVCNRLHTLGVEPRGSGLGGTAPALASVAQQPGTSAVQGMPPRAGCGRGVVFQDHAGAVATARMQAPLAGPWKAADQVRCRTDESVLGRATGSPGRRINTLARTCAPLAYYGNASGAQI